MPLSDLFRWLFGVGDEVQHPDGTRGTVVGHKPEGMVDVRVRNQDGSTRIVSKFGGRLEKVEK